MGSTIGNKVIENRESITKAATGVLVPPGLNGVVQAVPFVYEQKDGIGKVIHKNV